MIPLYTHAAAALVAGAVAFGGAWQVQGMRYGAQIAELRLDAANEVVESLRRTGARFEAINTTYQGALNDARVRETTLRRDLAAADSESDGLRSQLAESARRIASAPPASVAEYALATGELLVDCSRRYQELAGKADGHASDVRAVLEAWPVIQ